MSRFIRQVDSPSPSLANAKTDGHAAAHPPGASNAANPHGQDKNLIEITKRRRQRLKRCKERAVRRVSPCLTMTAHHDRFSHPVGEEMLRQRRHPGVINFWPRRLIDAALMARASCIVDWQLQGCVHDMQQHTLIHTRSHTHLPTHHHVTVDDKLFALYRRPRKTPPPLPTGAKVRPSRCHACHSQGQGGPPVWLVLAAPQRQSLAGQGDPSIFMPGRNVALWDFPWVPLGAKRHPAVR